MSNGGHGQPSLDRSEHIGPQDTGDNIEAKRVAIYEWDGSAWVRKQFSGTLTIRMNEGATYTYIGKASPGTATSAASWQIARITNSDTTLIFADGDANFDNVWDNHASLSYS